MPDVSASSLSELISLRERRVVVTGGGRGLGKAIADRLAEAGARLLVGDVDAELAKATAAELADRHGSDAVGVEMDVTDSGNVRETADLAVARWSGLDAWVNNAGVFPSAPIADLDDATWDQVFAVNARGTLAGTRESARVMGDGGVVVNVCSTAGFRGSAPGLAAYVGSKHAVRGLTRQSALELAPQGIRVLAVAPSYVPTEGNQRAIEAAGVPDLTADDVDLMMPSPIGRTGTPDDIARVVFFCVSDLSMVMTGSTLLADGGTTA
ncbi:SDR family NAD(P)-dependent oxidoreductase [Streptomyces sp. NPDC059262]|uniref:SDR family NAD(P)-dependent oxidoreductase n=1 Tax=Streptomyces sp. NPDC059262 TaxID=3346797 RepID=UPI00369C2F4C